MNKIESCGRLVLRQIHKKIEREHSKCVVLVASSLLSSLIHVMIINRNNTYSLKYIICNIGILDFKKNILRTE